MAILKLSSGDVNGFRVLFALLILYGLMSCVVYFTVHMKFVRPLGVDAPLYRFSEARAIQHVRVLAEEIGVRQVSKGVASVPFCNLLGLEWLYACGLCFSSWRIGICIYECMYVYIYTVKLGRRSRGRIKSMHRKMCRWISFCRCLFEGLGNTSQIMIKQSKSSSIFVLDLLFD